MRASSFCLLLLAPAHAMFEDQVGKIDWYTLCRGMPQSPWQLFDFALAPRLSVSRLSLRHVTELFYGLCALRGMLHAALRGRQNIGRVTHAVFHSSGQQVREFRMYEFAYVFSSSQ